MIEEILTITGFTCSGKTTLQRVLRNFGYESVVSHTTRKPRPNEVDGKDYYFVDDLVFLENREQFIEMVTFNGTLYGIHSSEIPRLVDVGAKRIAIVAEPSGVKQIRLWCSLNNISCKSVFLTIDTHTLYRRFLQRFVDTLLVTTDNSAAVLNTYASRLATILEERGWLIDASMFQEISCGDKTPLEIADYISKSISDICYDY